MKNGSFYEMSLQVAPCLPRSVWGSSFANGKREQGIHSLPSFLFILDRQPLVFAALSGIARAELPLTDGL